MKRIKNILATPQAVRAWHRVSGLSISILFWFLSNYITFLKLKNLCERSCMRYLYQVPVYESRLKDSSKIYIRMNFSNANGHDTGNVN